jgi:hypothetical protein
MQKPSQTQRTSGAKAVAIDDRALRMRYRLYLLLSLLLSGAFALSLHILFGR